MKKDRNDEELEIMKNYKKMITESKKIILI